MRTEYLASLRRYKGGYHPLSVEALAEVTPHLDNNQRREVISKVEHGRCAGGANYITIAAPPILGIGLVRTILLYPEQIERAEGRRPRLPFRPMGFTMSSAESAGEVKAHFVEEAVRFAELSWGESLRRCDWKAVVELVVFDSKNLRHGLPDMRCSVVLGLDRSVGALRRDIPTDEALDEATVVAGIGSEVVAEIALPGRFEHTIESFCSRCGGSLGTTSCSGCGSTFEEFDFGERLGLPLTRTARSLLRENGFRFDG